MSRWGLGGLVVCCLGAMSLFPAYASQVQGTPMDIEAMNNATATVWAQLSGGMGLTFAAVLFIISCFTAVSYSVLAGIVGIGFSLAIGLGPGLVAGVFTASRAAASTGMPASPSGAQGWWTVVLGHDPVLMMSGVAVFLLLRSWPLLCCARMMPPRRGR